MVRTLSSPGSDAPKPSRLVCSLALTWLAGLLWLMLPISTSAVSFTASFDRDAITLGESVTLTLTFEGGTPDHIPMPPPSQNIRVATTPQVTMSTEFVNGTVTQTQTHAFQVTPLKVGTYNFPAMAVKIDGQDCMSKVISLKVSPAGESPAKSSTDVSKWAFLKLLVPKDTVYFGEVLPVEMQLFFQAIQGGEMPHLKEDGFTLGKTVRQNDSNTSINGQQYNIITLKSFVVPAKLGQIDIGPATMDLQIPKSLGRDWFQRTVVREWEPATLESEPKTLQVIPLPTEGIPTGFNGAVGSYSINVTASPTNVAIGDPITLKIQVTGHGALEALTLPAQTNWGHFKLYPPTSDFQASDQLGISGTRTFALTVVPESIDIKELPPYVFSFFDPEQKKYRTAIQPATPLIIRPSAASLPPAGFSSGSNPTEITSPHKDLSPLKPRFGTLAQIQPPFVERSWFVALQGIPVLAWITLMVRRRQTERLANNPRLRRQIQVEQTIRNGLKELREYAQQNNATEFFATLFRVLQEQLGERLDLPASAITEAVLDERLRPLGAAEEQLSSLRDLFHACNQARYARNISNAELVSLVPKAESALNDLKQLKT